MNTFVTVVGNLTGDPELRFTLTGRRWPTSGWPSPPGP
jgi:single-stranded DNA-binding protein